jgi:sugar-specific transcriptional regulator TrmB
MDTKTLEMLGLEQKQAKIYLALLQLKQATATKISEDTRIERTLCYSIINKLIDKGLISYIIQNNVKYFKSAPPEKLMQDLKEKQEQLTNIMPQLIGLTKLNREKTRAELYQGKEGIKTVLKDIIKVGKDHIIFGEDGLQFEKLFPIYSKQFVKKLEKENIKERVLFKAKGDMVKAKGSEFRYLPDDYFSPTCTVVYGNKTAIIIWSEPFLTILIENKEVARSYRNYFEILWGIAKK